MNGVFEDALKVVLVYEGGYANLKNDPGGATMKGVTQRVYDAYRIAHGRQKQSVRNITDAELNAIYRSSYWDAVKGDDLPAGVDLVVFDGAVNSGPKQSIKWLQRALGVTADGIIGQVTMAALRNTRDNDALLAKIIDRRRTFLRSLTTYSVFGRGWESRLINVLAKGQAWATGSVGPQPVYTEGSGAKADLDDVRTAPPKAPGDIATGTGVGSGGISVAVQQLQDTLTPFSTAGGWIVKLVVILAITSAVLTIGGLAWRAYATYRQRRLDDATDPDETKVKKKARA